MMRWDLINRLLARSSGRRYLEIGVQTGMCGQRVKAAARWGVDPHPYPACDGIFSPLHKVPSDQFFDSLAGEERFDVIFVDGLHHAEQVYRDVRNALAHLAGGGTVVMHDCNPQTEAAQLVPRQTSEWNGDCWRAVVRLRSEPDVEAFVIDADEGLGVVRPGRGPGLAQPAGELTYQQFDARRSELLALVPRDEGLRRLGLG